MDHLENSDPSQVWRLEGSTLENKAANLWKSQDEWKFGQKGEMYYIENVTKKKVLGATNFGKVIEEDFEEDNLKPGQLWKKVDPVGPTTEGDVLLENYESTKFMTAISNNSIEIKGNLYVSIRFYFVCTCYKLKESTIFSNFQNHSISF